MASNAVVSHKAATKSILDLINLYNNGNLNLTPGFQRKSVWKLRDRKKLIDSVLRNYPLPAIFLYRREEAGKLVFDVIDGKQRLETILMFTGEMRGRFHATSELPGSEASEEIDWATLKRKRLQHLITGYEIPVIEVDGEIGDVIDVFVRINSTGKALTRQEQRHAKYYNSPLLKEAARLAKKFEKRFLEDGNFTSGQIARMKHAELICELMLSVAQGDVLNKKTALDRVMATSSFDGRQLKRSSQLVTSTLNRISRMFPELKSTRLSQITDFYTLAVLIGKFEQEGLIMTDRRRNQLAWELLKTFSTKVDEVRELQRRAISIKADQQIYRDYLLTVLQATDEINQRRHRESILRGLLQSLFERKDSRRGFSSEQRRILWNSSTKRVCSECKIALTWDDFTIDHIDPYSKGGRSKLENAALMCRKHNSSKGNRSSGRKLSAAD